MRARVQMLGLFSPLTAILAGMGCTPFETENAPPIAVAGDDQVLQGAPVTLRLDGSESFDPDGEVVGWQWRYTGRGPMADEDLVGAPATAEVDEDGGVIDVPPDDTPEFLKPRPEFCPEVDPEAEILLPERWCFIAGDDGTDARARVELVPGSYRFTLWVFDDAGDASDDTLLVTVEP